MSDGVIQLAAVAAPARDSKGLLWLWAFYPILVPFYFMGKTLNPGTQKFTSGVPQIPDYYLVLVMALVFYSLPLRVPRAMLPVIIAMAGFVGYSAVVNAVWAAYLEDLSLLKSTLFYGYDCLSLLTCLLLYERFRDAFIRATVYAVAASVLLQTLLSPFALQEGFSRQALFFNDENQLGYYCVLAASIFALIARRIAVPLFLQGAFYTGLIYVVFLSQCRAALVALGVLAVVTVIDQPIRLLLVAGGGGLIWFISVANPSVLDQSQERFVAAGEYDTPATRGYDRILNYPEHIVFGAGEGAYERFRSALYASEIHSSYGTLLFCYGIIGIGLFGAALLWIAWGDLRSALFLIPSFVYGSAHHGVRAAFFWVMVAVVCCIALESRNAALRRDAPEVAV